MTVVGESTACTRAATWSLLSRSSCSRKERRARVEAPREGHKSREATLPQNGAERGVAVEETREVLLHEELLSWSRLFSPDSSKREPLIRQAQDSVRRSVEPVARLPLRRGQVGRGRGEHLDSSEGLARGIWQPQGGSHWQQELLCGPAVLQVMQEGEEGNRIIGGPKGGRKGEVNELRHWAQGDSYGEDGRVAERKSVESRRVEDSRKGRAVPSRQAASPEKELFPGVKGLGKAVKVEELSEDAVDEIDAKDGAPTRKLHEG
eukprot:924144-Pleurochrysis_carterae.AAC.2